MPVTRTLFPAAALAALLFVLALAGSASAATKNGITTVAPKGGASVPAGKSPVFRMRVNGPGQVWVHVCKNKRKNADGLICATNPLSIGRAKKRNGVFEFKPKLYRFDAFWMNNPGRYFWQAHRIACNSDASDCRQEGPTVRFRVR
jgi:hypothetical protein